MLTQGPPQLPVWEQLQNKGCWCCGATVCPFCLLRRLQPAPVASGSLCRLWRLGGGQHRSQQRRTRPRREAAGSSQSRPGRAGGTAAVLCWSASE